jgi:folate-binding protein YgfZ
MTVSSQPILNGYFPQPAGCLRLTEPDRRAFLQRQTTNHIDLLTPERSLLSVLTSPTARILDVFILLEVDDSILILTLPGHGESTYRYLRSRIFFNDKVALNNESQNWTQIDLFGPAAETVLDRLGLEAPGEANHVCRSSNGARVLRHEPSFGLGYRLLLAADAAASGEAALSATGLERLSPEAYDRLRVERGLPAAGRELTDDYTPLEAGLRMAISDHKGCYTGQEVLARQITYDKVTRQLCGLRLDGPADPGVDLLAADGAPAGRLTSVANSPRLGWIGLGIVKRPHHQPGSELRLGGANLRVVALPFSE